MHRPTFVRACLTIGYLLLVPCVARGQLLAGAARVDITPDITAMQVPLGGYAARKGKPATGVKDPIFARAIVLQGYRAGRAAIVSVDLCFLPGNVRDAVAERLHAAGVSGLPADRLFLAATHSHTSPDPLAMHAGNRFRFPG